MKKLIERAKKELEYETDRVPTAAEVAEKIAMLEGLQRDVYNYAGQKNPRTRYEGGIDISGCDTRYHAVYLVLKDYYGERWDREEDIRILDDIVRSSDPVA